MSEAQTDWPAWSATVLGTLGLIITSGGSSLGAVLFVAAWALLAAARADQALRLMFRSPGLWLVPALAVLSAAWSVAPLVTLRLSAELAATAGIASLCAGFLRPRDFVSAMSVSLLVGAALSLALGRSGVDGLTGEVVFLGIFASKNILALFMSFLMIFATAVLADRRQAPALRVLAGLSFLVSVPLLVRAHSAGAMLTTVAALAVLMGAIGFARLRPGERLRVMVMAAAAVGPAALLVGILALNGTLADEVAAFIRNVLGKDPTLTGRTVLWQIALAQIAKHPLEGSGYGAFWLQGNLVAESVWRTFAIDNRSGFHFHDTVLEVAVEMGWPGAAALLLTVLLACQRAVRLALADRTPASAALVAALFCLALRMIGEVDLPSPFAIGTFLFFVAAGFGADYARALARRPAAAPAWGPRPAGTSP